MKRAILVLFCCGILFSCQILFAGEEESVKDPKVYVIQLNNHPEYYELESVESVEKFGIDCLKGTYISGSWVSGMVYYVPVGNIRVMREFNSLKEYRDSIKKSPEGQEKVIADRRELLMEHFLKRSREDGLNYSKEQIEEIDTLYQVANKEWNTPKAIKSLKEVVKKYPKSNRAGCALVYLAQMSEGQEKENYLKTAIEKHSDCWYGDGVNVGALAKLFLAGYYQTTGEKQKAEKLIEEIREKYPDAIDHQGKLIIDYI